MGNTIIKVSHVGIVQRQIAKYNGPPTDEELAIAKRAAETTRKAWADRALQEREKYKVKLAKQKKAQERKDAAKAKRTATIAKKAPLFHGEQRSSVIDQTSLNKQSKTGKTASNSGAPAISTPAKKLGITDAEFERRLNALRKFQSESVLCNGPLKTKS